jgi:hypothetical protein
MKACNLGCALLLGVLAGCAVVSFFVYLVFAYPV